MFEQGVREQDPRERVIADLRRRVAAVGERGERVGPALRAATSPAPDDGPLREVLPVPEPLVTVFPHGGLPRGGVVSLAGGTGSVSLLWSLLAASEGSWSAVVGMPDLGLAAADELGVDLDRLVLVPDPGPDVVQVISTLIDGVDLVVTAVAGPVFASPGRARVLSGRLRQRGAVLLAVGPWDGADLVLRTAMTGWSGLGLGHGRLRDRELEVTVSGRRMARPRSVRFLLCADRDRVQLRAGADAATGGGHLAAVGS